MSILSRLGAKSLAREWADLHAPRYIKVIGWIGLINMAIQIPLDHVTFKQGGAAPYLPWRVAFLLFCAGVLIGEKLLPKSRLRDLVLLVVPVVGINWLFMVFLQITGKDYIQTVSTGSLLIAFFSSFITHRFGQANTILLALSTAGALLTNYLSQSTQQNEILHYILCHLFSYGIMFYLRREFFSGIQVRYENFRALVPPKLAWHLALMQEKSRDLRKVFEAKDRFAVCLSSDWRGYQSLAKTHTPAQISELFRIYYDIVWEQLDRNVPSGCYYADWWADELFVIFFEEGESRGEVVLHALEFANALATKIHEEIQSKLNISLNFDIGMSAGIGFIGLQGPQKRMKTTISGEMAGVAKRLEMQAKALRITGYGQDKDEYTFPIVVLDQELSMLASNMDCYKTGHSEVLTADTKDVAGIQCTVWQKTAPSSKIQINTLSAV
jgi:hypothetical protein